jgi:membrane fusion protein (multidrug efflux system)
MRWALLSLGMLAACSSWSGEGEEEDQAPPEPVTVVQTQEVTVGDVADRLLTSATIEAAASADITAQATGTVVSIAKDVGDVVRRGELLAVIDNVQLDAGAERADAEVANLTARVAEAEKLHTSGAVSSRELEDLKYQLATARTSQREAARGRGTLRLTAPFDGLVAARDLHVGEQTSPASVAFTVVDPSELRVRARLPERDVSRVKVGQVASLTGAYDASGTATAHVTRIAPVIDATSGTFEVVLTLDPTQTALRPGQFVSVDIEVDKHTGVVVVPKDAVLRDRGQPIVFVVTDAPAEVADTDDAKKDDAEKKDEPKKDDAKDEAPAPGPRWVAKRTEVQTGLGDPDRIEITGGLAAGARIVVVGQSNLKDGARIREPVVAATPADPAAAPAAPAAETP